MSAFLYLYNFPRQIDIAYPAIEYRAGEPQSAVTTTVTIKGILNKPLFRAPSFHGQFIVDKYEYTKTYQLWDIEFYQDVLFYHASVKGKIAHEPLGSLFTTDNFAQLNIMVAEPTDGTQRSSGNLRISAPANNYEEAMEINKNLISPLISR